MNAINQEIYHYHNPEHMYLITKTNIHDTNLKKKKTHKKTHTPQSRKIRTVWLPRSGNLLCRAGEDLSDLPDGASIDFFQSIDFNSSDRCRVILAVFILPFHDSDISFLSIIKLTDPPQHVIGS